MTILQGVQEMTMGLFNITHYSDFFPSFGSALDPTPLIAQAAADDLWRGVQQAWNNFVQTGQIWAFFVGIAMGWWIRDMLP